MKIFALLMAVLSLNADPALAMSFGDWKEQRFSLFSGNEWFQFQDRVLVTSDDAVSLIWTPVVSSNGDATAASWTWSVDGSVPATTLDQKGGDDRNLALYFVFMPREVAEANRGAGIRKLLGVKAARVLMYVWGGDYKRGQVLVSPYLGPRGRTIVQRSAGIGEYSEVVDLAADYFRAFGEQRAQLVGLAISSDSDDTNSRIRARLESLELQ
jgi:hypothetical protein